MILVSPKVCSSVYRFCAEFFKIQVQKTTIPVKISLYGEVFREVKSFLSILVSKKFLTKKSIFMLVSSGSVFNEKKSIVCRSCGQITIHKKIMIKLKFACKTRLFCAFYTNVEKPIEFKEEEFNKWGVSHSNSR